MRLILCLLIAAGAAFPQLVSFGVKGGAPVTALVKSNAGFSNGNYTVGPTVELHLPFHLSLELDALYRSINYGGNPVNPGQSSGSAWEFPLLAKYRFARPFVSPFLDIGVAFNTLTGLGNIGNLTKSGADGIVVGGGLEGKFLFIRVAPELRYTHWRTANIQLPNGASASNQNQFEALVGITF